MKPHKWAKEIHAIADGIEVQWAWESKKLWSDWDKEYDASPITSREGIVWRIKPPEVDQWRKDMAQSKKAGKMVEFLWRGIWRESICSIEDFLNPEINLNPLLNSLGDGQEYYRVRSEPKENIVKYLIRCSGGFWTEDYRESPSLELKQIKVVFDGETGKPISAEVL